MTRNLFSDSRIRNLKCTGAATFDDAVTLTGAITGSGGLTLSGTATFDGAITAKGNVACSGTATFAGAMNASGTSVFTTLSTDDVSLPGTFTATGVPGQVLVPNTGSLFIYVAVASNTWARVAVTGTAFA